MIGPIVAAAATTAAAYSAGYPSFFIAGIKTEPVADASATADPETPAIIILATMLTWDSPPLTWPKRAEEKSTSLLVIPPVFMRSPARMKKGIARNPKESSMPIILSRDNRDAELMVKDQNIDNGGKSY